MQQPDFKVLEHIVAHRTLPPSGKKKKQRRITPTPLFDTMLYNTSMAHFERGLIVKRRYELCNSVYVLLGLDAESFQPRMHLVDTRLWMQLGFTTNCLDNILRNRTAIDKFFHGGVLVPTVYTNCLLLAASDGGMMAIRRCDEQRRIELTGAWELEAQVDASSTPAIMMSHAMWSALKNVSDSLYEYHKLCCRMEQPADYLMTRYADYLTQSLRPTVTAADEMMCNFGDQEKRDKVLTDLRDSLPKALRELSADRFEDCCDRLTKWLDAEIRAFCGRRLTSLVIGKLSVEFTWLKP